MAVSAAVAASSLKPMETRASTSASTSDWKDVATTGNTVGLLFVAVDLVPDGVVRSDIAFLATFDASRDSTQTAN